MMNKPYEPDMLDEIAVDRAKVEPEVAGQWEATKIVVQLRKQREDAGLTQSEIAARMGLPQQRVAEIERRPWGASFARILAYAAAVGATVEVKSNQRLAA